MDIFNTPYLYAKRYVAKSLLSNDILVFPRYDAERDDNYQNYIISIPDLITSIASLLPASNPVVGDLIPLFTTIVTPGITPTIAFTPINQNANLFYAGPTAGGPAAPTFRPLSVADMPGVSGTFLTADAKAVTVTNGIITAII